jgi:hypothetical protein
MSDGTKQLLIHLGAFSFGVLIGWFVYYINRYRKGDVQFSDITTLVGVIAGGSVTALFTEKSTMFGAYGIGLGVGFFAYFIVLIILVTMSDNFTSDWFLDGRRKAPEPPYMIPGDLVRPPMDEPEPVDTRELAVQTAAASAAATVAALQAKP